MVLAKQMRVTDVLAGVTQLQIPLFQREYEWGRLQWNALFDDIARLGLDRQNTPSETHFLGPLVTAQAATGKSGKVTFIVDGQQRLLTFTLLLCALRDSGFPLGPHSMVRINSCLHRTVKDPSAVARLRLLPTDKDRHAFLMIVDGEESIDDHRITKAYQHFRTRITTLGAGEDDQVQGVSVAQFTRAALAGLECVRISAQPGDNVNRIYETLNNRGMKLSQGDLIRNYVFMRLGSDGQGFYEKTWVKLADGFKGEDLTHLFWLDLVRQKPTITQRQTYTEQYKRLEATATNDALKNAIKGIAKRGDLYKLIKNPEHESHDKVRRHLTRLHDWGSTTVHPILMYLLELRENGRATSAEIAKAMLFIESYYVRRMVMGQATMNMNRVLLAAGEDLDKQLRKVKDPLTVDVAFRRYLSGEGKKWGTDDELRWEVATSRFYRHGRAGQKALALRWIEEGLGGFHSIPSDALTVEHVMPQTIKGTSWLKEIKAGLYAGEKPMFVYQQLVHTLGNLTLATPEANAGMSNKSFSDKKQWLHKNGSGLKITAEITAKHAWLPDHIRARSETMAERIIKFWPGPIEV